MDKVQFLVLIINMYNFSSTNTYHLAKQRILVVPRLYVYVDKIFHLLQMLLFNILKPLYTSTQQAVNNFPGFAKQL